MRLSFTKCFSTKNYTIETFHNLSKINFIRLLNNQNDFFPMDFFLLVLNGPFVYVRDLQMLGIF